MGPAVFAGVSMESLALAVFILWSALFLCGPLAYGLARYQFNILAVLVACAALWLGVFWFATIYTWAKYLGLISAVLGLLALLKVTDNFYDR